MFGTYINNNFGPRYYGKALNISRRLTAAYDKALESYDLLLMPTTPMKATPLPAPGRQPRRAVGRALRDDHATPRRSTSRTTRRCRCRAAWSMDFRSGLMLIGRHFDEMTIYRAAHAFEQSGDWKTM